MNGISQYLSTDWSIRFWKKQQVDEAYTIDEFEQFFSRFPKAVRWAQRTNFTAFDTLLSQCECPDLAIQKLRLIKSPAEVAVMQEAADITCEALVETIRASHPFVLESQLGAKFDFESRIRGSERSAYPLVIAGE